MIKTNTFAQSKRDALRLLQASKLHNQISYVKPCQSGKTDVMCALIELVTLSDPDAMFFLTCCKPNKSVTSQTENRILATLGVDELPSNIIVETPLMLRKSVKKLSHGIKLSSQVFLILDESHTHLNESGLGQEVWEIASLAKSFTSIYFTATPGAQSAMNLFEIKGEVSEKYIGIEKTLPQWEDLSTNNIGENPRFYYGHPRTLKPTIQDKLNKVNIGEVAILRPNTGEHEFLSGDLSRQGWRIFSCDGSTNWHGLKLLTEGNPAHPLKKTAFILKQGLGIGTTIKNRSQITLAIETLKANESATIQGLPGRLCGYEPLNPNFRGYCNLDSLYAVLRYTAGKINSYTTPNTSRMLPTKSGLVLSEEPYSLHTSPCEFSGKEIYRVNLHEAQASLKSVAKFTKGKKLFNCPAKEIVEAKIDLNELNKLENGLSHVMDITSALNSIGLVIPKNTTVFYVRCQYVKADLTLSPKSQIKDGAFTFLA